MQRYEPPDDPNNEPTRFAGYGGSSGRGYGGPEDYYSGSSGQPPGPPEPPPTPWYLKPAALIGWGVLSATLIALLIWGIIQLIGNDSGSTTTSSTATTPSATTTIGASPTTASPIAPAVTTTDTTPPTTTEPPTTTTTTEPSTTTEPPTAATTTPGEGYQLPSEITLPTVIHLPPGL